MIANQIDNRGAGSAGVVEVRDAVGEARAEMQQSEGRAIQHAAITIRSAGADTFEEAQNGADARDFVEGGNDWHFGSPWIGQAQIHPGLSCGLEASNCSGQAHFSFRPNGH